MNKSLLLPTLLLIITLLTLPSVATAQSDDEPVVNAVLFYSPTCPHCHQVISEVLLPMLEVYGDQLQIVGIDTTQQGGGQLYQAAIQRYQIPTERRGVPTLVVDDVVLVGASEIPDRFPGLVEAGLARGGIDWPDIPGLVELMAQAEREPTPEPAPTVGATPDVEATVPSPTDETLCRDALEGCEELGSSVPIEPSSPEIVGPVPPATPSEPPSGPIRLTHDGVVRLVLFWSETCPHCHKVIDSDLPPLVAKYGDQLEIAAIETSTNPRNYEIYLAAIDLFNVPPERQGVPALYIGDVQLIGSVEIPNELEGLIERFLELGGVDYPPIPGLEAILGQPVEAESVESEGAELEPDIGEVKPIYLAYFYQTGCQDCDRVKGDLSYLGTKFPQLIVEEYNVRDHTELSEWLGERAGVPTSRRLTAPTVFVGDHYLLEEDLGARSLETLMNTYTPEGAERVWENWEEKAGEAAQRSIVERFRSLGFFAVVFAGLVDGLNPCAFATLVFFVSYLTISDRKGKDVLSVGAAFTLGVFIAYMAVGVGLYRALDLLGDVLTTLGRWLYGLTAALCLILAVFSFLDYLKARRGEIGEMALNLPHRLRMQINATIRRTRKSRAFVSAAFVAGVVVSFLELACTGQVYLPTIMFVISVPELKARATLFLLLYNILFVLPLVVVFVLAYYGTGAKQFSNFLQRRASTVKLGMSFLFLMLGGWLAFSLI